MNGWMGGGGGLAIEKECSGSVISAIVVVLFM